MELADADRRRKGKEGGELSQLLLGFRVRFSSRLRKSEREAGRLGEYEEKKAETMQQGRKRRRKEPVKGRGSGGEDATISVFSILF